MTIYFTNYGEFYPSLTYNTQEKVEHRKAHPRSIRWCSDFIEAHLNEDDSIISGAIHDYHTGAIVATIERDEDEVADYDGDWDYNEDMGFDPYLGCYTDDC